MTVAEAVGAGIAAVALGVAWMLGHRWARVFGADEADAVVDRGLRVAVPVAALSIGIVGGARGAALPGWGLALAAACVLLAIAVGASRKTTRA